MTRHLAVRADGGPGIGLGHLARCRALAQEWTARGGAVTFVCAALPEPLAAELADEDVEVVRSDAPRGSAEDAAAFAELARARSAAWTVVDGYAFDAAYHAAARGAGARLLVVDDHGRAGRYDADLVLDQNVTARPDAYAGASARTRLLLGPRFALLRREFAAWRGWTRPFDRPCRVVVTLGGTAPPALLEAAAGAARAAGLPGEVLLAPGQPEVERAAEAARKAGLEPRVGERDVAAALARADVAVGAAGSTSWELCLLGLPAVLVPFADNQRPVARALAEAGVGVVAEAGELATRLAALASDGPARRRASAAGRALVDGRGAERVVDAMEAIA